MPPTKYDYIPNQNAIQLLKDKSPLELDQEQYDSVYEAIKEELRDHEGLFIDDPREARRLLFYEGKNVKRLDYNEDLSSPEGRKKLVDMAAQNRLFLYSLGSSKRKQISLGVEKHPKTGKIEKIRIQSNSTVKLLPKAQRNQNTRTPIQNRISLPTEITEVLDNKPRVPFYKRALYWLTFGSAFKAEHAEIDKYDECVATAKRYERTYNELDRAFMQNDYIRKGEIDYGSTEEANAAKRTKSERTAKKKREAPNRDEREIKTQKYRDAVKMRSELADQLFLIEDYTGEEAEAEAAKRITLPMRPWEIKGNRPASTNKSEENEYHRQLVEKYKAEKERSESRENREELLRDAPKKKNGKVKQIQFNEIVDVKDYRRSDKPRDIKNAASQKRRLNDRKLSLIEENEFEIETKKKTSGMKKK